MKSSHLGSALLVAGTIVLLQGAVAQHAVSGSTRLVSDVAAANATDADILLPDAPAPALAPDQPSGWPGKPDLPMTIPFALRPPGAEPGKAGPDAVPAKRLALVIRPGQSSVAWTKREKFESAFVKEATFDSVFSFASAAAYGNWRNLRPHYGTDVGAFGERLGAAALRQTTQSVFNVGLFSSMLHDDPRYYVQGPTKRFAYRFGYAVSRVAVTRRDRGGITPNLPLFAGVFGSSLLSERYYPSQDRDAARAARSALFSLLYRVGTQQLKEFGGDIRERVFHRHS